MTTPDQSNPFSFVRSTLKDVFSSPDSKGAVVVALADEYLSHWESMFSGHKSRFRSIQNLPTQSEREAVTESAGHLSQFILTLSTSLEDQELFERHFFSEITRITATDSFTGSGLHEFTANSIVMATTTTLFMLRDNENFEFMGAVTTAILFCFVRYPDWIGEK
jgi:hypothetical protein